MLDSKRLFGADVTRHLQVRNVKVRVGEHYLMVIRRRQDIKNTRPASSNHKAAYIPQVPGALALEPLSELS